ncbi:MAG: TolC family protein [Verrucomicrobiota bacterium]
MTLLLAGCETFHSQPVSSSAMALNFERRTLDDPDLRRFLEKNLATNFTKWPLPSWDFPMLNWVSFYYHPDLDVARAQWAVSGGGVAVAKMRPNPTVSFAPEYTFSAAKAVSPWVVPVNFDQPIETAGKRRYRTARANYLAEAARLNVSTVASQARKNLRDALIDLAAAKKTEVVLEKQKASQTNVVAVLEQELSAGAIAAFEISTARLALHRIQLDLGAAQSLSAEARSRVAEALGLPLATIANVNFSLQPMSAPDDLMSPEVRRQALQSRSDLLGALAEYAASQSALQLETAKQYPDLHLGTGYQYDQGDNKWTLLSFSLELPLLNRNEGGIAEAKAQRDEAAAKFIALQAKVISEIDRALAVYQLSLAQSKTSEALWATQAKRQQSITAQFKAGAIERLDLLTAEVELGATELFQSETQAKAERASSDLEFAVQRPLDLSPAALAANEKNPRAGKGSRP